MRFGWVRGKRKYNAEARSVQRRERGDFITDFAEGHPSRLHSGQEHRLKPVLHGGRSCYDPEISLLLYDCVVGLVKEHIAAWHTAFEAAQTIAKRAGATIDGVPFQAMVQVVHADDKFP